MKCGYCGEELPGSWTDHHALYCSIRLKARVAELESDCKNYEAELAALKTAPTPDALEKHIREWQNGSMYFADFLDYIRALFRRQAAAQEPVMDGEFEGALAQWGTSCRVDQTQKTEKARAANNSALRRVLSAHAAALKAAEERGRITQLIAGTPNAICLQCGAALTHKPSCKAEALGK
jgi:hypothetical protein